MKITYTGAVKKIIKYLKLGQGENKYYEISKDKSIYKNGMSVITYYDINHLYEKWHWLYDLDNWEIE